MKNKRNKISDLAGKFEMNDKEVMESTSNLEKGWKRFKIKSKL